MNRRGPIGLRIDLDGSTGVNGLDIPQFVLCFMGGPAIGPFCECANMDANTTIDSADVGMFVSVLLASATCT